MSRRVARRGAIARRAIALTAPIVSAGADVTQTAGATFNRTATLTANPAVTSQSWYVMSGPLGETTTLAFTQALSWIPGSSVAGGTAINQPVIAEMAFEITSTAENSDKAWTNYYSYIEDILDGRGYTAGLVGFTSATGDMLGLVQEYIAAKPTSNTLAPYLDGLQACADYGDTVDTATYGVDGGGASDIAASELGSGFLTAWANAANNDPVFRRCQRDYRKRVYWDPAFAAANADGVGPLGMALYYDTSVNHGPGVANSGDGSFDDIRSRTTGTKPINGGAEVTWLNSFKNIRSAVLTEWGDNPSDGRISMFTGLINAGHLDLLGAVTWNVYGTAFSMNRPDPPPDARLGSYVVRYTATNSLGTTSATVTVTVA